ncbi:MAG: hypothetical protein ACJAYU_002016 [Bradymonadia bacterium]|jgi:hypothetical protein
MTSPVHQQLVDRTSVGRKVCGEHEDALHVRDLLGDRNRSGWVLLLDHLTAGEVVRVCVCFEQVVRCQRLGLDKREHRVD